MHHPKTLVLTESPFSNTNGFGVTLKTLMAEWPSDRFLVLYRSRRFWDDTCRRLRETRDRAVHMPLPGKPLLNPVHVRELARILVPYVLGRTPSWFGRYSRRWIEDVLKGWRPDVVYSWYYSPVVADYGAWLADELGIPQVLHVGDDAVQGRSTPTMERIVREAAARIAISGQMKREFEERFDAPFHVVHNGASDEIFEPASMRPKDDRELVIRYVGSLLRAHQFNAIEDIVEAVRLHNARGGNARFEIFCPDWTAELARELAESEAVEYAGFAEKPRNYELLKSADLLVLPVTFDEEEMRWVRLSMPTKLPEYLASGTPTLVYGPRGVAPVEFCIEHGVGIVRTKRSVASLVEILTELEQTPEKLKSKGRRDRRTAADTVSARVMRKRLRDILVEVAGGSRDGRDDARGAA